MTWLGLEQLVVKKDCVLTLADVVWSAESTKAGVLFMASYCSNLYLTYYFKTGTIDPGEEVEELQAASVVNKYGLPVDLPKQNSREVVHSSLDPVRMAVAYRRTFTSDTPKAAH
jgi:hypothetical protein